MRTHLYEFRSQNMLLKCSCGWERKLKSADVRKAEADFAQHRAQAAAARV